MTVIRIDIRVIVLGVMLLIHAPWIVEYWDNWIVIITICYTLCISSITGGYLLGKVAGETNVTFTLER